MRILFTSYPLHSHVNPMMPITLAASAAGHEAALATGSDITFELQRWGIDVWPVGPTHAEVAATTPPSPRLFTDSAERRAGDLIPRALDWQPDLVIADEFELAGHVTAAVLGVPLVVHGLGLMTPAPIREALEPAVEALHDEWGRPDGAATLREAHYLDPAPASLRSIGPRVWTRTHPIRPVPGQAAPGERLSPAFDALPNRDTVHLAFSSDLHYRPGVLESAVDGLSDLGANLVVAAGPHADLSRFGPQPAHVVIERYIPPALALPRCQLVVSQGAAGIMFGALTHAIPHLMLPHGGDQFMNTQACVTAGAALALPADGVSAAAVTLAARRLLSEPGFAIAAATIGAEIRAMPSADRALAALLDDIDVPLRHRGGMPAAHRRDEDPR